MTTSPLLEVSGLSARYGPARVLHGIDLTVNAGSVVVLLGANGAGKTTLLRALSGTVTRSGSIMLAGTEIGSSSAADIVRRGLSHVPEGRGTFHDLTVEENLRLGAISTKKSSRGLAAMKEEILEVFPVLAERSHQRAGLLSGGEQQMLAIGRALMADPALLVLDEPSLGLAPIITERVFAILAQLRAERGLSMLVVEQNAELSLSIADYAYVIEAGVIRVHGDAESVRDDAALRSAYLGY